MRILLTSHRPLGDGATGRRLAQLREALRDSHEVRVVQAALHRDYPADVRVVLCRADDPDADLAFAMPTFEGDAPGQRSFASLSNAKLAAYREAFRAALDSEIEGFDPDIVHAQHLWIDGHLALESGAPYVVAAEWDEWDLASEDDRFARYVRETAENAGRILTDDFELRTVLSRRLDLAADRFAPAGLSAEQFTEVYREVLDCRFGRGSEASTTV